MCQNQSDSQRGKLRTSHYYYGKQSPPSVSLAQLFIFFLSPPQPHLKVKIRNKEIARNKEFVRAARVIVWALFHLCEYNESLSKQQMLPTCHHLEIRKCTIQNSEVRISYSELTYIASNSQKQNRRHQIVLFFFIFQSSLRFTTSLRGKYRGSPYSSYPYTCIASSIINIPHQSARAVPRPHSQWMPETMGSTEFYVYYALHSKNSTYKLGMVKDQQQ